MITIHAWYPFIDLRLKAGTAKKHAVSKKTEGEGQQRDHTWDQASPPPLPLFPFTKEIILGSQ